MFSIRHAAKNNAIFTGCKSDEEEKVLHSTDEQWPNSHSWQTFIFVAESNVENLMRKISLRAIDWN